MHGLLSGLNFHPQDIVGVWQLAGCKGCKRAGRVIGFVEVDQHFVIFIGFANIHKPSGRIGLKTVCHIPEYKRPSIFSSDRE